MITEDYVSFETAKLLKENGFNKDAYSMYMYDKNGEAKDVLLLKEGEEPVLRPTLQMAMKWLREVHNIDINIYAESLSHKKRYTISIWKNIQDDDAINDVILGVSTIYEEACETAIKYCLENLI